MNNQLVALAIVLSLVIWFVAKMNASSWLDLEQELELCREEVRILQLERGIVEKAGHLAAQLGQMAHQHGRVCQVAYEACGLEEFDERQESAGNPSASLRRYGGRLQAGGDPTPSEPVRDQPQR